MIYLQLFWVYLKIGLFGFGGGYAMLSLIQFEVVERHAWMSVNDFADIVAISQMTPGPISINCATYVGYNVGGILGSLLATFALVFPSLIVMFFVIRYLFKNRESFVVKSTLATMKPIIAGLIFAAGMLMMNANNFSDVGLGKNNYSIMICTASFICVYFLKINPILLILVSGALGYLIY